MNRVPVCYFPAGSIDNNAVPFIIPQINNDSVVITTDSQEHLPLQAKINCVGLTMSDRICDGLLRGSFLEFDIKLLSKPAFE
ncbi:MAG: hypothetical protein VX776_05870, partial [Planctomycetota bacterium]|nr:hypothetical protein [Planctomycetota bacterium]